jgi:tRNA A-37 threonylcarbamoyl transferase component Bud32
MDLEKLSLHIKSILKTYKETNVIQKPLYPEFFNKVRSIIQFLIITVLNHQVQYWHKYGIRVESTQEFNDCLHQLTKDEIGRGYFGVVYKVPVQTCIKHIPKHVHTVAVKIEKLDLNFFIHTPEKIKETVSIAKKAAKLKIGIQLYDVFVVNIDNEYKLVKIYEYIDGQPWEKYKFKSTKEYNQAIHTLQHYITLMNKHGILHKDLHTDNVMITTSGKIYIIDFDLASYSADFEKNDIILFYKNKTFENNYMDIRTNYVYNELVRRKVIKIPNKTYKK